MQSIFGETYQGVPNPVVPVTHPYPTRYHGPMYNVVRGGGIYQPAVWYVPLVRKGVGASPDGLGLDAASTGSTAVMRLAIGAGLGLAAVHFAGQPGGSPLVLAGAGAASAAVAGLEGIIGCLLLVALRARKIGRTS
jgi:hypothetical protein